MARQDNGTVNIHGKEYKTVALRVDEFRAAHPDFGLLTEIVSADENRVVMRAEVTNADGFVLATGHAEENRKSSQINKTSALENCETSAIGRALAAFGFGGTEFASANEVVNAIHQQANGDTSAPPAATITEEQAIILGDMASQLALGDQHKFHGWMLKSTGAAEIERIPAGRYDDVFNALKKKLDANGGAA